jgi:hypothetical protein
LLQVQKNRFKKQERRTFMDRFISVPAKMTRSGRRTELKMYESHFREDWEGLDALLGTA